MDSVDVVGDDADVAAAADVADVVGVFVGAFVVEVGLTGQMAERLIVETLDT